MVIEWWDKIANFYQKVFSNEPLNSISVVNIIGAKLNYGKKPTLAKKKTILAIDTICDDTSVPF
jgi:hypothetical protein